MCGRYTLFATNDEIGDELDLPERPTLAPRYNIAPTQFVPVVGLKPDLTTRGLALLRWGLVPYWADDPAKGPRPINLMSETVGWKFGEQFRRQRCLLPADGFYEWKTEGQKKRPHHFALSGGGVFAFAGVWDAWGDPGAKLVTCCTLTTTPNELVGTVHNRMPVIVPHDAYADWLDPATPERRLRELLAPFPAARMTVREVGTRVNKATNEGSECLAADGAAGLADKKP